MPHGVETGGQGSGHADGEGSRLAQVEVGLAVAHEHVLHRCRGCRDEKPMDVWVSSSRQEGGRNTICSCRLSMFAGHLDHQTIISDQPVLVLDGEAILNSFSRLEDATDFLIRTKNDTAVILRHNGRNWDVCRSSPPSFVRK